MFATKNSLYCSEVNQVSPHAEHEVLTAQFIDVNFQSMMRIIRDVELPPSHPNIENQFPEKRTKNCNQPYATKDVLYWQCLDYNGIPVNKQSVDSISIVDYKICTLIENSLPGHSGASERL